MTSNVTSPMIRELRIHHAARLGNLFSPGQWRLPPGTYALDNGRFKGEEWTEAAFLKHCDRVAIHPTPPRWLAVPDVFGDPDGTLREWDKWAGRLRDTYGWKLALVWQDGITPETVKAHTDAEVQFIGGKKVRAKWLMVKPALGHFPRVHVGKINAVSQALRLWRWGVESVDGTGWCLTNRQRAGLKRVLECMARGDRWNGQPELVEEGGQYETNG